MVEYLYQFFYRSLIELTNGKWSSHLLKRFSSSSLSKHLIPSYARVYNINQDESSRKLDEYENLHSLFTRQLKENARVIAADPSAVVSPVDGVLEDYGEITLEKSIIVKGRTYSIEEMLEDPDSLQKYLGGSFMVLYLSPSHYHRIHAPVSGTVKKRWVLGKKSYPVNKFGMKYGRAPLSKNYRNITEVEHEKGMVAIVKVGAMFVNSIEITEQSDKLVKGQEFAYFSFGSTVVLLFEKGIFQKDIQKPVPSDVRVGEKLGVLTDAEQE
ncbi:phosphatidylserine decarboxylase [Bacillus sp. OV322]|uniref:phosphatidylserine decarboxylase n=1 Tax=Bacillus sp. OV322 TaxID=1882764 RepID=UPI0015A60E49|nr:phosphatidylserine decarboxylase [Bacillus sp. OV322]